MRRHQHPESTGHNCCIYLCFGAVKYKLYVFVYILLSIWLVGVCFSLWHFSCLLKWSWSARSIMKHTHTQVIIKRRCPRGKFIWKASLWKPIKPITAAKLSKVRRAHERKKKNSNTWANVMQWNAERWYFSEFRIYCDIDPSSFILYL